MTITALTLSNPGAESGSTTGWTTRAGSGLSASSGSLGVTPHSGSRFFLHTADATIKFDQTIDVSAYATAIDNGTAAAKGSVYYRSLDSADLADSTLFVECYAADGTTLLGDGATVAEHPTTYAQQIVYCALPSGTRSVRIGATGTRVQNLAFAAWDDFALDISDDKSADYTDQNFAPIATQIVAYALATFPSSEARASQIVPLTVSAAETSSGFYNVNVHQVVAYALVKGKVDRVDLRAWPLLQDDHLFYGLQLGSAGTIVFDLTTAQWTQWFSPGFTYFRCEDVTDWEGYNLGADTENGTIWKIDPTGRLDDGTTVITSQVTGQATVRGRRTVPCYTAELACSQASPAGSGCSMQLRTSDDSARSWVDHGTVDGEAVGTATLFRWYGLGLMQAPGRLFEITNTGYARRLDGLDAELGQS